MSDTYQIAVVTKVPDGAARGGNLALADELFWSTPEKGPDGLDKAKPLLDALAEMLGDSQQAAGFYLSLRQPVFRVGEVLILDESGREIGYPGRKPSKWFIEVTEVDSLEEAHKLARKVIG